MDDEFDHLFELLANDNLEPHDLVHWPIHQEQRPPRQPTTLDAPPTSPNPQQDADDNHSCDSYSGSDETERLPASEHTSPLRAPAPALKRPLDALDAATNGGADDSRKAARTESNRKAAAASREARMERNRKAAAASRERKRQQFEALKFALTTLRKENDELRAMTTASAAAAKMKELKDENDELRRRLRDAGLMSTIDEDHPKGGRPYVRQPAALRWTKHSPQLECPQPASPAMGPPRVLTASQIPLERRVLRSPRSAPASCRAALRSPCAASPVQRLAPCC